MPKRYRSNFYQGIRFASRAELSCAIAMETFIPDWRAIEGETYNKPIGHGKTCDFVVLGVFIEFHPIIICREMQKPIYRKFRANVQKVRRDVRRRIKIAVREHLFYEYSKKREWTMRQHSDPYIRDADLIVCDSARDFYRKVIKRFGKKYPGAREFEKQFKDLNYGSR